MDIRAEAERIYTRHEHLADAVIHVIGVLFAINGGLWLLFHVTGLSVVATVSVYCAGLFAMLSASAAYNLMPHHRPSKQVLRRLDHAAIFIMIAATYTPFAVNRLSAPYGDIILPIIWVTASAGVVMKMLYPRRFELFAVALYLAMGWLSVVIIRPLSFTMADGRVLAPDRGWPGLFGGRRLLSDRAHPLSQGDLARLCAGGGGLAFLRRRP